MNNFLITQILRHVQDADTGTGVDLNTFQPDLAGTPEEKNQHIEFCLSLGYLSGDKKELQDGPVYGSMQITEAGRKRLRMRIWAPKR